MEKLVERERVASTFGEAAEAWHRFRSQAWDAKTAEQARHYLGRDLLPKLRSYPLDVITPAELGALVAGIGNRGAFDVAKKTRQWLKGIYSYARASGWTAVDPARDLAAIARRGPEKQHYAHLQVDELPSFLRALEAYDGSVLVKACTWLSLWTANRPGVTRGLRWGRTGPRRRALDDPERPGGHETRLFPPDAVADASHCDAAQPQSRDRQLRIRVHWPKACQNRCG